MCHGLGAMGRDKTITCASGAGKASKAKKEEATAKKSPSKKPADKKKKRAQK